VFQTKYKSKDICFNEIRTYNRATPTTEESTAPTIEATTDILTTELTRTTCTIDIESRKKTGRNIIIGVIIFTVFVLLGSAIYLLAFKKKT